MRNVIFVAPFAAETTLRFVRATRTLEGIRLLGIVHTPPSGPDASLFDDFVRVTNPMDLEQLHQAVQVLVGRHGPLHRILGILEPMQVELATLRERFGVAGLRVRTAELFRDKARMKAALVAAGLPCARYKLLRSIEDARAFVSEVGLPIVLKPPAGMGCKATWRITSQQQLDLALAAMPPSPGDPTLAEELIQGREHSCETITLDSEVKLLSLTEYHPTPLEVMENPWIQWAVVAPRQIEGPELADARALGVAAVQALGLETAMTHMEWFRRPDGSLAIGEIAARPPGANIVRLTGLAYDTSLYRAWARAVVDAAFDGPWPRSYATGAAFLRGIGRGRVIGVEGLGMVQKELGSQIVEAQVPQLGALRKDTYEGDGYILVRHSETEAVKQALWKIINNVRVRYG